MSPAFTSRRDSLGALGPSAHHLGDNDTLHDDRHPLYHTNHAKTKANHIPSLNYTTDESDVYRGHLALNHYRYRGQFWNVNKHHATRRYFYIAMTGILQACVAYFTNILSSHFIDAKFNRANTLLAEGKVFQAGFWFVSEQALFAIVASFCVWAVPVAAGSGIPEVKCFLNGIDLPHVGELKTLVAKVVGVIGSVSAGLPVGKEGPMVHSGAVVATCLASGTTRNDKEVRDLVACGAAAGVCTAFSAPIGGILFSLEEGASYWKPSLTWRTFFCSMMAFTTLLYLNTLGAQFGKLGFNKLFSFGNFLFEEGMSSFAVYELMIFVALGVLGGLIGAIFNDTNERLSIWRQKRVNHSKEYRFLEVVILSVTVSLTMFLLPLLWRKCTPLPSLNDKDNEEEVELLNELVQFTCPPGTYNELASLFFCEPGVAIRQLFHLHKHAFSDLALLLFFIPYISLAVVVYGIAVPSGLFVPSLLSGAAFGRLVGNQLLRVYPNLAFSNTYALVGAAAVLGGMARMTISLTVILLECTGNEQYVLPLMLTLMTARLVGQLFNHDLYHIHIGFKKGVHFLETEIKNIPKYHDLTARQVMSDKVVFFRPVEKVENVVDTLLSCSHSSFPVVDPDDNGVLMGTIGRNELCVLLQQRAFGYPVKDDDQSEARKGVTPSFRFHNHYMEYHGSKFFPLVGWPMLENAYPKYPQVEDIRLHAGDRECFMDLRPYANSSPVSIQEKATVTRTYELFRTLGMRFLPVVNLHNQVVGTITRADLSQEALAGIMLVKGKKNR